jgi:L-ascorbate metabolism protein UlaG (beta-lactamase superfamily)
VDWKARKAELDRLHRSIRVARSSSLLASWTGAWLRAPAAALGEPIPRPGTGQVAITFGGHATALIRYRGATVVCDPMLGRWVGGVHRAVEPGLTRDDLAGVNVAVISHAHHDHLHVPTLSLLPRTATIVVPRGCAAQISPLGFARVIELAVGDDLARTNAYVIAGDGPSVYVCGDGAYGPGFEEAGRDHAPDLALLPIGGFLPLSFRARHMSPLDALYAFEDLRARLLIPIHHGAFQLSYEKVGEPARWLRELVVDRELEPHVRVLDPGESEVFTSPRRVAPRADGAAPRLPGDESGGVVAAEVTALRSVPWPTEINV